MIRHKLDFVGVLSLLVQVLAQETSKSKALHIFKISTYSLECTENQVGQLGGWDN